MVPIPHRSKIMVATVALAGLVLFIDWTMPLGLADWALYIPVILLASRIGERFVYFTFSFCSLLTLIDYFFAPGGVDPSQSILNRLMGIVILSGVTLAGVIDRRRSLRLAESNRQLQREIAERQKVEDRLRESEARYRRVELGSNDGLWDWNIQTGHAYPSPRWLAMLGLAPGQFIEHIDSFFALVHPEDRPRVQLEIEKNLEQGVPFDWEFRLQHQDGRYLWVRGRGQVARDTNGRPLHMAGAISDISDRKVAQDRLAAEEHRLRQIFDSIFSYIALLNPRGEVLEVNKAPLHVAGLTRQQVLGKFLWETPWFNTDLEMSHRVRQIVEQASRGLAACAELSTRLVDGRQLFADCHFSPILDDQGAVQSILAYGVDITDRKFAQQRDAQRLERMSRLSELALTLSGDPTLVFESVVRIIGELFKVKFVCLSELIDRPEGKFLNFKTAYMDGQVNHELGDCPLSITPCQTVFESRELRSFNNAEALFPQADLLRRYHIDAYCGIPSLDNQGNVVAITCLLDDHPRDYSQEDRHLLRIISQRIAVELERARELQAREESQRQLQMINAEMESIFRAYPDLHFILDSRGVILQYRAGDPSNFCIAPDQFMNKPMQQVMPGSIGRQYQQAIERINAGDASANFEFSMPTARGMRHYEARLGRLPDRRIAVQVRDTTDAQKAQEEIKLLSEELAHLSRLGTLGEMASGLAHELNQPLTSLHNYACAAIELAKRQESQKVLECLDAIASQSLRAGQIVHHMRSFVRRGPSRRAQADLHQLIGEVLTLLQADLRQQHVDIEQQLEPRLPHVLVDTIQIQQVLVNLIRNAVESLSGQPQNQRRIVIETQLIDQSVAVRITDSGPGIDSSVAARLFQPFQTTKPDGLGLGLAICRTLIENHGGSIGVASASSGGAIFHFTLPIAIAEIPA